MLIKQQRIFERLQTFIIIFIINAISNVHSYFFQRLKHLCFIVVYCSRRVKGYSECCQPQQTCIDEACSRHWQDIADHMPLETGFSWRGPYSSSSSSQCDDRSLAAVSNAAQSANVLTLRATTDNKYPLIQKRGSSCCWINTCWLYVNQWASPACLRTECWPICGCPSLADAATDSICSLLCDWLSDDRRMTAAHGLALVSQRINSTGRNRWVLHCAEPGQSSWRMSCECDYSSKLKWDQRYLRNIPPNVFIKMRPELVRFVWNVGFYWGRFVHCCN